VSVRPVDGRNLSLTFGAVEVACVSSSVVLDAEDAPPELVTFADVVNGDDRRWYFTVSGFPDYGAGSFWSLLWEIPAYTPIGYLFKPYGNAAPSVASPHFGGYATVDHKPPIGGDAGKAWTFDARLTCLATPTRLTASGKFPAPPPSRWQDAYPDETWDGVPAATTWDNVQLIEGADHV
jgi:hypothetical protein